MSRRRVLVAAAAAAVAGLSCFSERSDTMGPGACDDPQDRVTVTIRDFRFDPAEVCLAEGGTVTWVNQGAEIHTSSSAAQPRVWDSGFLAPGAEYTRTFPTAGTYAYLCLPHPFMTAAVVVR